MTNSTYLECMLPHSAVGRDVVSVVFAGQNSSETNVFVDRMCGYNRFGFPGSLCGACPDVSAMIGGDGMHSLAI